MTELEQDEYRVLKSLAIGMAEAMFRGRMVAITPEVGDVLIEWLQHPSAQQEPVVRELITKLNAATLTKANRHQRRHTRC